MVVSASSSFPLGTISAPVGKLHFRETHFKYFLYYGHETKSQNIKSMLCLKLTRKRYNFFFSFFPPRLCRFLEGHRVLLFGFYLEFLSTSTACFLPRLPPLSYSSNDKASYIVTPLTKAICLDAVAGASPYSMGPTSQGTPTPMMSPAPPGGPQDSMGYNLNMNGNDYASPMSGSQVHTIFQECKQFVT